MKRVILAGLLLVAPTAWSNQVCSEYKSSLASLLSCAEQSSPEIREALLEIERARAGTRSAGQWRNPDFSLETFNGNLNGETRAETDMSLGIPIELGGKVAARKQVADANLAAAEARHFLARAQIRTQIILKLHRLRQVIHEQEIISEAIGTFTTLVSQYGRRPQLSPEQQLSVSVYEMSRGDYELKKAGNQDELLQLETYFKLSVGLGPGDLKSLAPEVPKTWPEIKGPPSPGLALEARLLQAEVDGAQGERSTASAEAWPTLTLGPSLKRINESGSSSEMIGFNLSLPIPTFNLNGGARAAAGAGVKLAEMRRQIGERAQAAKREELVKAYGQSVRALATTLSHREIERRHAESEKLFQRGIVPASLVIEAHRASYELERARHERELRALEAWLGIRALDGRTLEFDP